jgi:hypothetical protein
VKAPKVYVRDAGLLHCPALSFAALEGHPSSVGRGGFAEQVLRITGDRRLIFRRRMQGGTDLVTGAASVRFEFKYSDARHDQNMHIALKI